MFHFGMRSLAVGEQVGRQPHRRLGRVDEVPARDVLLEDVVLGRAAQLLRRRRPAPRRRARRAAAARSAGALIVIEVETSSSGMPSNAVRMSSIVSIATPVRPTSPRQRGSSESRPSWVGRSKAIDRPGRAVGEQVLVALVGLLRRRVAGVLAHRPQPLAVHLAVHAARVGELAGLAEVEVRGQVGLVVERLDLDARVGEAARVVRADDRGDGEVGRRPCPRWPCAEGTLGPWSSGPMAERSAACRRSTAWRPRSTRRGRSRSPPPAPCWPRAAPSCSTAGAGDADLPARARSGPPRWRGPACAACSTPPA